MGARVWVPLALVLFAVGSVPPLVARASCPGVVFSGALGNSTDTKQQLAWIQRHQHDLLLPNVHTTESFKPYMFNGTFLLGGVIARGLGGRVVLAWHLLRLLGCFLLAFGAWAAVRQFVAPGRRALALVLGFVPPILSALPLAVRVPEWLQGASYMDGNSLFIDIESPQANLAVGLVLLAVCGIDRFWQERGARLASGVIWPVVVLWVLHPFEFWAVGFVFAVAVALMMKRGELDRGGLGRAVASAVLMATPVVLYLAADHVSDGGFSRQNRIFGNGYPLPNDLILSLGVTGIVAALVSMRQIAAPVDRQHRVLVTWLAGALVSLYLPLAPWRWHQINGLPFCTAFLVARADFVGPLTATARRAALSCVGALALALALQAPYWLQLGRGAVSCAMPFFYPAGVDGAFDYLAAHAPKDSHVMCRARFGLDVPVRSLALPYVALLNKTPGFAQKNPLSTRFFDHTLSDGEARRLLTAEAIAYVLCEPADAVCNDAALSPLGYSKVFDSETARVYERR